MLKIDPQWTLEKALELVRDIEPKIRRTGFSVALAGSVLHRGYSTNDLDLIIFPLNAERFDTGDLRTELELMGWKRKAPPHIVAARWYKTVESTDSKHVEVWATPQGRVDIFYLK